MSDEYLNLDPSTIKKTYVHKVEDMPVPFPGFSKITDDQGKLPDELSLKYDDRALEKLEQYALSQGRSPWADIRADIAEREGIRGLDQSTQLAQMRARAMAPKMSGESGAIELMRQRLGLGSEALSKSQRDALMVDMQDRQNKLSTLRQLPSMQVRASLPQQFNIRNAMEELKQEREAEREAWKQKMAWEGSKNISEAMRR